MSSTNSHFLISDEQRAIMLANGRAAASGDEADRMPVVKLFTPDAACTWLLSELDPGDPDIAFGLCDLGMGFPELGSVRITELESIAGPLGFRVERDLSFVADRTLSQYADAARRAGAIQA
jgi:hypothetical protein